MNDDNKHGALRHAANQAQDTVGGMAGKARASTVTTDQSFVEQASVGNLYEIEAAELALGRCSSPGVKSAAQKMLADHTTATHHMQAALEMNETSGVKAPPTQLDARRNKLIEHLRTAPDDRFDETYVDQQVLAHEETLTLLNTYRDRGGNAQLRSVASATAPVVQRHLQLMKSLKGELSH